MRKFGRIFLSIFLYMVAGYQYAYGQWLIAFMVFANALVLFDDRMFESEAEKNHTI
jgi:hypothetical protein